MGGTVDMYGADIKARANFKTKYSTDTGQVRIMLATQPVDYAGGIDTGCNFYGDNKNAISSEGVTDYVNTYCTPDGLWRYCTTASVRMGLTDAVDATVFVYNRMQSSNGLYTDLDIDRTRVMVNYN